MQAGDAVICEPVRTPVGRYRGRLAEVTATKLAATAIRALLERTEVEGEDVDEVLVWASAIRPARHRRSGVSQRWTQGSRSRSRGSRSTGAVAPASRRCCRPRCKSRPATAT